MTERQWAVNGLGDYSEFYSERLQSWVKLSRQVVTPSGMVEATGRTDSGERVTVQMNCGETWLVR